MLPKNLVLDFTWNHDLETPKFYVRTNAVERIACLIRDIKVNIDSHITKRTRLNFALVRFVIEPATQRIDNQMQLA